MNTDNKKEECLQEAGMDLGRYGYKELIQIKDGMRRYHEHQSIQMKQRIEELEDALIDLLKIHNLEGSQAYIKGEKALNNKKQGRTHPPQL